MLIPFKAAQNTLAGKVIYINKNLYDHINFDIFLEILA